MVDTSPFSAFSMLLDDAEIFKLGNRLVFFHNAKYDEREEPSCTSAEYHNIIRRRSLMLSCRLLPAIPVLYRSVVHTSLLCAERFKLQ